VVNKDILLQYRLISLQNLTTFTDKDYDVKKWYNDLISWFRVQKLNSEEEKFNLSLMKVQGEGAINIQRAVKIDGNGDMIYPDLEEMKKILLKTYKLEKNPDDIVNEIKSMKLQKDTDIKEYNKNYMKLYNELPKEQSIRITSYDYLDSIIRRSEVWKGVKSEFKNKSATLSEVMDAAEFYDKMEKEFENKIANDSTTSNNRNNKNSNNHNDNNNNRNFNYHNNFNNTKNSNNHNNGNNFNYNNHKSQNNHKVSFCKFCNESGHRMSDCPSYIQFQYFKYMDSLSSQNNFNNYDNRNNYRNYAPRNNNFNNFNNFNSRNNPNNFNSFNNNYNQKQNPNNSNINKFNGFTYFNNNNRYCNKDEYSNNSFNTNFNNNFNNNNFNNSNLNDNNFNNNFNYGNNYNNYSSNFNNNVPNFNIQNYSNPFLNNNQEMQQTKNDKEENDSLNS